MKKKLMCLVLSLCMMSMAFNGCGASEDASFDTVTVTKELETEYAERMEAYLAYYQEQDTDTTGVIITLDEDHLPLMWLCYGDDDTWDGIRNIQLLCYKDDKVEILAERNNTIMIPVLSNNMVMAEVFRDGEDDYVLVYDEEKKDFKSAPFDEDGDFDGIGDTGYYYYVKNGEITYLFYAIENDEYFLSISNDVYENSAAAAKKISGTTKKVIRVDLSQEEVSSLVDQINSDSDNDTEETVSRYLYYKPDGKELSVDEYEKIMDYVYSGCEIHTNTEEINEYWGGVEAESLMRTLIKHPAYTTGEMLAVLHAVYEGYSVADTLDFDNMSIDTTEYDNLKERIIELVKTADFNYAAVDDIAYDIAAAYRDSEISPSQHTALKNDIDLLYAKLDEAAEGFAWFSAYMDCVSENDLYAFVLADIDDSGVPALICSGGIYKYNGSSVNQVRDNYTTAVRVGDDKNSVLAECNGSVYGEYVIYNTETFEEQRALIAEDTTEGYWEWIYYWSDAPDTILSQEEASSVFADLEKKYPVTVFDVYSNVYFDSVEEAYNYYLENK